LNDIPDRSTFSRAFTDFSDSELAQNIHVDVIQNLFGDQINGHISRDSTAINAREKPEKTPKREKEKRNAGDLKKAKIVQKS